MVRTFTITSYGKTKEYPENQRKKMIKEFETAMLCCDGSEAEHYRYIYGNLVAGENECMDTERPLSPELEAMIERMFTTQKKYSTIADFLCCIPVSDTLNLLKQFHSQLFRISNLPLITKSQDFIYQFVSHKKSVIK